MTRAHWLATGAAGAVMVLLMGGMRIFGWLPFVLAGWTYLAVWFLVVPRRRRAAPSEAPPPLPDTVGRADYDDAMARLGRAAYDFRALADRAKGRERALFRGLSEQIARLRAQVEASPVNVVHIRPFWRHTLGQMVEAAQGYAALSRRAKGTQAGRLAEIYEQIAAFGPALDRIEQACLENDLTALEVHIEVLSERLSRRR